MSKSEKPAGDVNHPLATGKRRSLVLPTLVGSLLLVSGLAAYLAMNQKGPLPVSEGAKVKKTEP